MSLKKNVIRLAAMLAVALGAAGFASSSATADPGTNRPECTKQVQHDCYLIDRNGEIWFL